MIFFTWQGQMVRWQDPLWLQVLRCTIFVLSCEFLTGLIVNKWLDMNIWDYSDLPFQLFGQICLPFAIIFSGLCVLGIFAGGYLTYWLYGEEKPEYHVL